MTHAQRKWKRKSTLLRKLLNDFAFVHNMGDVQDISYGKFHLYYDNRKRMFFLYNGIARNVIATFKWRSDNHLVVRYRRSTRYMHILTNIPETMYNTVRYIPSDNLGQYRDYSIEYTSHSRNDPDRFILAQRSRLRERRRRDAQASFEATQRRILERMRGTSLFDTYMQQYTANTVGSSLTRESLEHAVDSMSQPDVAFSPIFVSEADLRRMAEEETAPDPDPFLRNW